MNNLAISALSGKDKKFSSLNSFKTSSPPMTATPNVPPPAKSEDNKGFSKSLPVISTAVALTSLGVAACTLIRRPNSFKGIERKMEELTREVSENRKTQESLTNGINEVRAAVNTIKSTTENKINELRGQVEGNINELRGGLRDVQGAVKTPLEYASGMYTRDVEVNGMHMQLATVLKGYGVEEGNLTKQLRTESARRILGDAKPIALPEHVSIHAPSAEFDGLTKTGGLATVPRELLGNLGAIINNKQSAELFVDTPMYIGQVENNLFLDIVKVGENKFQYIRKQNGKQKKLADLTKVDTMNLEIYTDSGKHMEEVGVYLSDEMLQPVDFEKTIAQFDKSSEILKKLYAGENVNTPLVRFTAAQPKRAQIQFADEKTVNVNIDDVLNELEPGKAGKIAELLDMGKSSEIKITDFIKHEGNQLKIFDDETASKIGKDLLVLQDGVVKEGKTAEPVIKLLPATPATAEVKFRAVLYDNRRFLMDGPVQQGQVKNIYNNDTTQAGETERNIYFCKYMYENLCQSHRHSDKPLKADWIIGNDWHTGPLTAMMRLLTPARKATGMEPELADKIYNTPTTTLMHNFKLSGQAWHSQPKLMNIMFGEHSAKIVENAWMPKDADMPGHLMNGLFTGTNVNPQTMAMAYADDIVFVSRGNFDEASKIMEKGGDNYALASMRGRTHQYADRARLEEIGRANNIDSRNIPTYPTAKGITNGCDRVNNIITNAKARILEEQLGLKLGSIQSAEKAMVNPFGVHQNNKKEYLLQRVIPDVELARTTHGRNNPMNIYMPEQTNLAGVDENTMVIGAAGRIVDQKGLDILAKGAEEMYMTGKYNKNNPPVLYIQGIGEEKYINMLLQTKAKVREIDPVAADRIVVAKLFSEPGRYDGCKMMSDFDVMPSWDEPCGLVHKEIGYTSGSISIVNKVGGLRDGLHEYVRGGGDKNIKANSIFVNFMDKDTHPYDDALQHNAKAWAEAMETAQEWYANKDKFALGVTNSYTSNHNWLSGKIQEYAEIGKRHGVLSDKVNSTYNLDK